MTRARKSARASGRGRKGPRAERVRRAILEDLERLGRPATLAELETARAIARDARELYITAERLRATGAIERQGAGYHQGDPHRYGIRS